MTEELLFSTLKYENLNFIDTLEYQFAKELDDFRKELEWRANAARVLHETFVEALKNAKEINVLMDDDFQQLIKAIENIKNGVDKSQPLCYTIIKR